MKTFLLFIGLCLAGQVSWSQIDDDWVLFNETSGIQFYKKETNCTPTNIPNQVGVLIKVVNTNETDIEVSWALNIWYDGVQHKANIKDGENEYSLTLKANSSLEGNCDTPNGALYVFKTFTTFTNGAKMTKFEFDNIKLVRH